MGQLHYIKEREKGKHLNFEERQLIEFKVKRAHPKKVSVKLLIAIIGCSESTVRRELKRGVVYQLSSDLVRYESYSAEVAQEEYDYQASGKGPRLKIANDYDFVEHVESKIHNGYSPDAVIMDLEKSGFMNPKTERKFKTKIVTKTLYNYIDKGVFPNLTNKDLLREGRSPKRKQRKVRRSYRNIDGKGIWERPIEATTRSEAGHWEMDCIEGAKGKGKSCLLTMVDRKLRETLMFKLAEQTQESVLKVINKLERSLGRVRFSERFKTFTVDNGSEFLDHHGIEKSLYAKTKTRTQVYYAHPYCSWERGTNEQTNGMVRRFIPKGSVICPVPNKEIKRIEEWLNNYPRRILDGMSANQKKEKLGVMAKAKSALKE